MKALLSEKTGENVVPTVRELSETGLPEGNVLVKVTHSSLNYTDARFMCGAAKKYPHIAGIDFSGIVESSSHPDFKPGDEVIHTGWGRGHETWGGYAEKATSNGEWLVKLPSGMSRKQAMIIGTAGFTAMLAIQELESRGVRPENGEILVTGATGGVGSLSVCLLAQLGYKVAASTGKKDAHEYLKSLGAARIIDRAQFETPLEQPWEEKLWAGAIDNVGSTTLAHALAQLKPGGAAIACGFVGGAEIPLNIRTFFDGITLIGIDSLTCPLDIRKKTWERIAKVISLEKLDIIAIPSSLEDLPNYANQILEGKIRGRVVVNIQV